ncbi:MAG: hypothetical protein FWB79_01800 [Treponema sp.]|nr:hypothetical protein [Treponema sp.]
MKQIPEKAENKKTRLKIQRRVKRPVFILAAFLSFSAWALKTDEEVTGIPFNASLVSFVLLLGLYYKMLTDSLNWVHWQLQDDGIRNMGKPTRLSRFIAYVIAALFPTIVFAGLYLLVFMVLLERMV